MKSLKKYRCQFVLMVTLVVGYSQLFFPMTTASLFQSPDADPQYQSQPNISGCINPVYYEEGRTDEDDKFSKKMVELPGFSLSFVYSVLELTARPSIRTAVHNTTLYINESNSASRVLRL